MRFILPPRLSEANIQAEFYRQCKDIGLDVYLEYKHEGSRFDEIKFIIEIKSYKTQRAPKRNTKQIKRYESYKVPVLMITRMEMIPVAIDYIISNIKN